MTKTHFCPQCGEAVWDAIVANDLDEVDEDEKETV